MRENTNIIFGMQLVDAGAEGVVLGLQLVGPCRSLFESGAGMSWPDQMAG